MNKRIVSISTLALIGAGLALIISILPYLCPVWAEKRAGGIDDKEAATLSAALSKQSLRLAEVEQKVSRLEGQAMGATAPISTTPAFEPYVWVQLYPDSMLEKGEWKTLGSGDMIARAIVDAGQACPTITIDGRAVALVPREVIYPVSFPVTLCETPEAFSGSLAVKLGNGDSLSWSQAPKNILIIGDTGCRITHSMRSCPLAWCRSCG
ncbi:MAG TPA: hypothetical protein VLA38_04025 [Steroidobacteraceae bacterium]|nr:hypothetical protein [Steroidobacteraceae bacterium]